jgi:predicted nucleic acid-binding protein
VRVFLDTNVWFSAFATAGLCETLLKKLPGSHVPQASELVWSELSGLLVRKLNFNERELTLARSVFDVAEIIPDMPEPTDDNDARLVAAASAAGAAFFVTGDRRVPGWKEAGAMQILNPREAWIELFAPHLRG